MASQRVGQVRLFDDRAELRHRAVRGQEHPRGIGRAQQNIALVADARTAGADTAGIPRAPDESPAASLLSAATCRTCAPNIRMPQARREWPTPAGRWSRRWQSRCRPCPGTCRASRHPAPSRAHRPWFRNRRIADAAGRIRRRRSQSWWVRPPPVPPRPRPRHRRHCRLSREFPGPPGSPADRRWRWRLCARRPRAAARGASPRAARRYRCRRRERRQRHCSQAARKLVPGRCAADGAVVQWPDHQSLRCRFSSISTMGCTNSETLPPSTAISRTKRRGYECVLLLRGHEDGFDFGREVPAHISQLKFEFEVRDGAQAAHDHRQAILPGKIDGQAHIAPYFDVLHIGEHAARHVDPLFEREHRRLVRIGRDGHHQAIEDAGRAPHQIGMAVGDRIESPRIDGVSFMHLLIPCGDAGQMIPHLARRLRFEQLPVAGQRRNTRGPLIFQVNQTPNLDPVAGIEQTECIPPRHSCPKGGSRKTMSKGAPGVRKNRAAPISIIRPFAAPPKRTSCSCSARAAACACSTNTTSRAPRDSASSPRHRIRRTNPGSARPRCRAAAN